jgi:predicted AlkP superfamily phosphohydrolase/phosphomutase
VQASDYSIIRQNIKESLLGMKDEKDNIKVIDKVFFKEEIYKGNYLNKMPDIIFLPKSLVYNSFGHYEFASNKLFEIAFSPTCTHRMNGIFMAYGDKVISSSQLEYVHITDIAPTILNLMGIEVLDEFDGRVLSEIFKNGKKDSEVIRLLPKIEEKEKFIYKEEEIEKVRKNLQDLGYIG